MVSMAMCYFYSWQTYAVAPENSDEAEVWDQVVAVELAEVVRSVSASFAACWRSLLNTVICQKILTVSEPLLTKLEGFTGRGGYLSSAQSSSFGTKGHAGAYGYSEISSRDSLDTTMSSTAGGAYSEDGDEERNLFGRSPDSLGRFDSSSRSHLEMSMSPG